MKRNLEEHLTLDHLSELYEELHDVTSNWFELGIALQLPLGKLEEIEEDGKSFKFRLLQVLECWLKSGSNHTWGELAVALGSRFFNRADLKQKIMRGSDCGPIL